MLPGIIPQLGPEGLAELSKKVSVCLHFLNLLYAARAHLLSNVLQLAAASRKLPDAAGSPVCCQQAKA